MKYEKIIDELVNYTIQPALYDDTSYKSEEEFDEIKQYLISAIQEIEYVEQYEGEDFSDEE